MSKVASIQLCSGTDVAANLAAVERQLALAAAEQVALAVLPENFAFFPKDDAQRKQIAETYGDGPIQTAIAELAARYQLTIIAGTLPIKSQHPDRPRSACLVFAPDGACMARYDKMHLFDVAVDDAVGAYQESRGTEPGTQIVTLDTAIGRVGLSICYDLRFPEYYRALIDQGAEILVNVAAFTVPTGQAHWEVLLRARAIENLSYVIASAQAGENMPGRVTYGHSMIIDPWGAIEACVATGEGLITSSIDLAALRERRARFPVLTHRRLTPARPQLVE